MVDEFRERSVEVFQHFDAVEFLFGDLVEFLFDVSSEAVVDDLVEVIGEEVGDEFADRGGEEFAFGGAGFFGDFFGSDLVVFELDFENLAVFALGFAFFDVAAGLDGGHDGGVGGRATDAEFFKFFDERAFGVAGGGFGESLTRGDSLRIDGVAGLEFGEFEVFLFAVDLEEAVKNDDFALRFEDFSRCLVGL